MVKISYLSDAAVIKLTFPLVRRFQESYRKPTLITGHLYLAVLLMGSEASFFRLVHCFSLGPRKLIIPFSMLRSLCSTRFPSQKGPKMTLHISVDWLTSAPQKTAMYFFTSTNPRGRGQDIPNQVIFPLLSSISRPLELLDTSPLCP